MRLGSNKRTIVLLIALYGGLAFFLSVSNPRNLPVALLMLPLLWLFVCLYVSSLFILRLLHIFDDPRDRYRLFGYAAIAAGIPVGFLLLQSIDQLTIKDVALILLLSAMAFVYISRLRFRRKTD